MKLINRSVLGSSIFCLAILVSPIGAESQAQAVSPIPVIEMEEEISVAAVTETNQAVSVVTREDIVALAPAGTVDLLARALGVNITSYGARGAEVGVSLRGIGGARVAVLVDGMPVNSPQDGKFNLDSVAVGSIERIEVVEGGSDARFNVSGAMGGIVNIVTRKASDEGVTVTLDASNLARYPSRANTAEGERLTPQEALADAQTVSLGIAAGDGKSGWNFGVSGARASNAFPYADRSGTERKRTGNGSVDGSASAALNLSVSDAARLAFSAQAFASETGVPGPTGSKAPGTQRDASLRGSLLLDADGAFGLPVDVELSASHAFSNLEWNQATSSSSHALNVTRAVARGSWYPAEWLEILGGIDGEFSAASSSDLGTPTALEGGAYAVATIVPVPWLAAVPSVKAVLSNGNVVPVPKGGLKFTPWDGFDIKANIWRAFRSPTFNDLHWPAAASFEGNPSLRPEDGVGGDVVAELDFPDALAASLALHGTYVADAIVWRSGTKWRPENAGAALYAGADLRGKARVAEWLEVSGSYSFLISRALYSGFDFSSGKRMPYSPEHSFTLSANAGWRGGNAIVSGHFEGERFSAIENVTKLDPFFRLDASVTQEIGNGLEVYALIANALDARYETRQGYPMPNGSVTLGIRARFGEPERAVD